MFSAENTERAQRQRDSPIKVILGNPPYNAHQVNANDANQNRKYPHVDGRIGETYAAASSVTLKNKLYDPYVRAFRWASDRVGDAGLVAFVTNDSFLDDLSFDGMRRHLVGEFDEVWVVNLGGNVRKDPKLSGTTHNVFGIQVGVAITFLVRTTGRRPAEDGRAMIRYAEAGADWKKERKYDWLGEAGDLDGLAWRELEPNKRHHWLTDDLAADWDDLLPLVSKAEKASDEENETTILDEYCPGVNSGRDPWVYGFKRERLVERVERFVDTYNAQVVKWQRKGSERVRPLDVVTHDDTRIKWSRDLIKRHLLPGHIGDFDEGMIRRAMYRPFVSKWLYYDDLLVDSGGLWREYFSTSEAENRVIGFSSRGWRTEFACMMLDRIGDYHMLASADSYQFVPFYVYAEDGSQRENLTDWALETFRAHYRRTGNPSPVSS